jgi:hypothetical protein
MSKKITKYIVVNSEFIAAFQAKVEKRLSEGWKLQGQFVVSTHVNFSGTFTRYYQPMIKEELCSWG